MSLAVSEVLPQVVSPVRRKIMSRSRAIERKLLEEICDKLDQLTSKCGNVLLGSEAIKRTADHNSCNFQMWIIYQVMGGDHTAHGMRLDETGDISSYLLEASLDNSLIFLHSVMSTSRAG